MPVALAGPVVVNLLAQPRFWGTVWADVLMASNSAATRSKALGAVERLYQAAADQLGRDELDRVIADRDFDALEGILTGFLTALRNKGASAGLDHSETWSAALRFVEDVMRHIGAADERDHARVASRVLRLRRLYTQLAPTPERPPAPIRALPAAVVEDLYDIFEPSSPRNPFKTERQRARNQLIFLMMLHLGLRRGELCILTVDAVKDERDLNTGEIRYWINIEKTPFEDEDPRFTPPSIKTAYSRRQLPVSREIVRICDAYTSNHRGTCGHPFLFNTQKEGPLSLPRLNAVFATATDALSASAAKTLAERRNACLTSRGCRASVSPHDVRHTSAVHRLARYVASGDGLDRAIEKLRVFFGWSPTSEMPRLYARAYFETALAEVWHDNFDSFVTAVRGLQGDA